VAAERVDAATDALTVIPKELTILDPAVRANPDWNAAVQKAGTLYRQASDALRPRIAPGTTPILAGAADTAVKALSVLGDSYTGFDPAAGKTHEIAAASSHEMAALCTRLAP